MTDALTLLTSARSQIEKASSIQELKGLRDKAEAIRIYSRQRDECLSIQNAAAEIKLRAERRMGELLAKNVRRGGAKSRPVTLAELGVSKMESSRWQAEAKVPEKKFEQFVAERKERGEEVTQAGLLRVASELKKEAVWEEREALALALDDTYQVVLADPPWEFGNTGLSGAASSHYPTMPVEEIEALPVGDCVTKDSVLFLWASNALLPEGLRVLSAWGFTYRSKMTWVKDRIGTGFWTRSQDEPILIGARGSMTPKKVFPSVFSAKKGRHSEKPGELHDRIDAMYPGCSYVELFARKPRNKRWAVWGNECALV